MREYLSNTAPLTVPGLFRRWDLTEDDRFPWSLPPSWNQTERRPSMVLAVRMRVDWRQEIEVTFECHALRKDGLPGARAIDYRLDSTAVLDDAQVPGWVRDEHLAAVRYLEAVQDAIRTVEVPA